MKKVYVGSARDAPDAVAPDGIPIHLVLCDFHTAGQEAVMGAMRFLGVAEGRIPPGDWGVHGHCSLEQVTYVLEGKVVVWTSDPDGALHCVELNPGQAFVTLPCQTLSFANPGPATARVLFLCAPPYPSDDTDTLLFADHRPLTAAELERAIRRQEWAKAAMAKVFDERIATLKALQTKLGEENG